MSKNKTSIFNVDFILSLFTAKLGPHGPFLDTLIENALDRLWIYHKGKFDVSKPTWIL